MYDSQDGNSSQEIQEAIDRTDRLTYRVNGGTIGFENEREFRAEGLSLLHPKDITLGGWPIVIGTPSCKAISDA